MKLKIINYFTYKKLNYDSVFDDSHNDSYQIYGKLVEGNFYAKIAWSSDLLQPEFLKIYPKVYAIGIDQNFAIYDFRNKHRIMCLDLMYLFCEMVMYDKKIFVATELEVFVIDIKQYEVIKTISLPDTYNKIENNCGKIEIHCMDNTLIKYQISNN